MKFDGQQLCGNKQSLQIVVHSKNYLFQ